MMSNAAVRLCKDGILESAMNVHKDGVVWV